MVMNYAEDVDFLKSCQIETLELSDETPAGARVCIVPQWQGRVMTSTTRGERGAGFGWINRPLIASKSTLPHFNPVGGEERFWLGPEGGPYSFYFAPGAAQNYENWRVPAALDTLPFEVVEASKRKVRLMQEVELGNASGHRFRIGIDRSIKLLRPTESEFLRKIPAAGKLDTVIYRSVNRITNLGEQVWTPQSGAPSIWMLGMFPPTTSTTVFIPYANPGSGEIVRSDYFGAMPANRLRVSPGLVCIASTEPSAPKSASRRAATPAAAAATIPRPAASPSSATPARPRATATWTAAGAIRMTRSAAMSSTPTTTVPRRPARSWVPSTNSRPRRRPPSCSPEHRRLTSRRSTT